MSEMLGNQYFLARKYGQAEKELEAALAKKPGHKGIRRKLIVCHTQTGAIQKAMVQFLSLITEDIDFIINTDPIADDCPCPELVFDLEKQKEENKLSPDYFAILGMLWLFCDLTRSIRYFHSAQELAPEDVMFKTILTYLKARQVESGAELST